MYRREFLTTEYAEELYFNNRSIKGFGWGKISEGNTQIAKWSPRDGFAAKRFQTAEILVE